MKVSKRIAAAILSVCMVVTSMGMQVEASNKDGVQPESVKAGHETGKEELEGFGEEELEQAKTQQMGQEAPKPDSSAQRVTEDKMETGGAWAGSNARGAKCGCKPWGRWEFSGKRQPSVPECYNWAGTNHAVSSYCRQYGSVFYGVPGRSQRRGL